jgi:hypothetical protein
MQVANSAEYTSGSKARTPTTAAFGQVHGGTRDRPACWKEDPGKRTRLCHCVYFRSKQLKNVAVWAVISAYL